MKRRVMILLTGAVVAVVALHLSMGTNAEESSLASLKRVAGDVHYTQLVPAGERLDGGIYDPSIAYTADGKVGWLAYSSVGGNHKPIGQYVHTHLARSTNGGSNWEFVKVLNPSVNGTLTTTEGAKLWGVWRYEVPTIVFDPTDPEAKRRWKLFVHYYFWDPTRNRMVQYGWIILRTAADPAGEWSSDVPLFGAGRFPPAPYNHTRVDLNKLDPLLNNAVAYSEPGALAHDGRLYLSLSAIQPRPGFGGVGHTVILLASGDHGTTWRFVKKLLDNDTARQFGCNAFDGSSLAEENGRFFLLVSPMRRGKVPEVHDGTVAFEFESLAEGRLRKDAQGLPAVAAYFAPQPGIFSGPGAGQACYHEANVHGGLIMPQFNMQTYPRVFQIYQTGRRITLGN